MNVQFCYEKHSDKAGVFGSVYPATCTSYVDSKPRTCAVKLFRDSVWVESLLVGSTRELDNLARIRYTPFTQQLVGYGVIDSPIIQENHHHLAIVSEWIDGMTLEKTVNQLEAGLQHRRPTDRFKRMASCIVEQLVKTALEISSKGVEHGDLHSGNIMVSNVDKYKDNDGNECGLVSVVDFGFSKVHGATESIRAKYTRNIQAMRRLVNLLFESIDGVDLFDKNLKALKPELARWC